MMNIVIEEYKSLLKQFLDGSLTVEKFQQIYLDKFKNETRPLPENLFELLDRLFGDVDSFSADPNILAELQSEMPGFYLDEQSLRSHSAEVFEMLLKL